MSGITENALGLWIDLEQTVQHYPAIVLFSTQSPVLLQYLAVTVAVKILSADDREMG